MGNIQVVELDYGSFSRYSLLSEDKSENLRNIVKDQIGLRPLPIFLKFEVFVRGHVGYIFYTSQFNITIFFL